jgi:hypothetical protein
MRMIYIYILLLMLSPYGFSERELSVQTMLEILTSISFSHQLHLGIYQLYLGIYQLHLDIYCPPAPTGVLYMLESVLLYSMRVRCVLSSSSIEVDHSFCLI